LGDVLLSTPVVEAMRDKFPEAYIAFMVRPEWKDAVKNNPYLDEVILYDKYGAQKGFLSTVRFALGLKKKKFDTGIALHPTNRVHIMMFVAGIPVRIGYDRNLPFLLTERAPHRKQEGEKHEADYNFDMLNSAGIHITRSARKPYMVTDENEKRQVDSVLKDAGLGEKIIAVHAGASCPSKRWPPERFAEAADVLGERCGCEIALIGGSETEEFSKKVMSTMKRRAHDLTGMFLVGELAEFLSRCKMLISNDSGPVHVSVAVGTPAVVIFGRNIPGLSPRRWGPLGERDKVLHTDKGCEICLAHNCTREFRCLKAITPEDVIRAATEVIEERR